MWTSPPCWLLALRTRRPTCTSPQVCPPWEGGLSLWVELPRADSTRLALAAPDHGVRIAPGVRFGVNGAYERFLRLPFSRHEADLDRAVEGLAAAWTRLDRSKPRKAKAPADVEPVI